MEVNTLPAFQPSFTPSIQSRKSEKYLDQENSLPANSRVEEVIIEKTLKNLHLGKGRRGQFTDFTGGEALAIKTQEIIKKLNELLKEEVPGGIESLKPEDFTPEATAERIVTQITSLFPAFQKQHSNLSPEESLSRFLDLVREGVDKGYTAAVGILDDLGAFEIDGVQESLEATRSLIEEKLVAFENFKKSPPSEPQLAEPPPPSEETPAKVEDTEAKVSE
ncbi:MAG: DUF5610 domain-containing protein [Bdellovibrionales bacterium]|nr:DUF5610 domain-containing protein [Bdellovibrionales bacterium]